jgi:hypothetical protein
MRHNWRATEDKYDRGYKIFVLVLVLVLETANHLSADI